jgi:hypothetical protein
MLFSSRRALVQEQQSVGKARVIGYVIGIAAAAVVIVWRLIVR